MSLKALAHNVLTRNPSRNEAATRPKYRRNFGQKLAVKNTSKLLPSNKWEEDLIPVIDWVLTTNPTMPSFQLHRALKVVDPVGYWEMLKSDIAAGPNGPRTKYGSLQRDVRKLAELFGNRS